MLEPMHHLLMKSVIKGTLNSAYYYRSWFEKVDTVTAYSYKECFILLISQGTETAQIKTRENGVQFERVKV